MSQCKTVRDLLALRPSDWSADEQRQIETHLQACSECVALARTYAEQDRLIRAMPRTRLTASQRGQLFSRIQKERRRHEMRTRVFTVIGTATAALALIALAMGLYVLFRGSDQPTTGVPQSTVKPVTTPEMLVFADEIRLVEVKISPSIGQPISVSPSGLERADPPVLTEIDIPTDIRLASTWQVVAPPGADWKVFVHLMNQAGELVRQSDVAVDWPEKPCPTGEYSPECVAISELEWAFAADFPPGLYTVIAGLYDPQSGARAGVTRPDGVTPPQVVLGQVQVVADEMILGDTQVTLHVFSGRPDPTWIFTPVQDADLRHRLQALPPTEQTFDEAGQLGYYGFSLLLPAADEAPSQRVAVWKGVVRVEQEGQVTLLADENRALEQWLLDTAAGHVEEEIVEAVRKELERSLIDAESARVFSIYPVVQDVSTAMLSQVDLDSLELEQQPIVSSDDILVYVQETHEIHLTPSAYERINQLDVPLDGRGFVVCVGSERIYSGAFWPLYSSLSFDGIVIEVPLVDQSMRIKLGYPESLDLFEGEDLRSDVRIMQSLEQAGKLE